MSKFMILKINNSKEASVKTEKWKDPGAKLYDQFLNAVYIENDDVDNPNNEGTPQYLKEAYLVAPVKKIKYGPYGQTPYSRSGCKYPHHVIRNGELIVHEGGLKAAYIRAKQMGIFTGEVREHLERHYKELGLYDNSTMKIDESMEDNFNVIESYLYETTGIDLHSPTTLFNEDVNNKDDEEEDLVPIFGMAKSYSASKYRSDGTLKSDEEIESIKFQKIVKRLTDGDNYSHALISMDDSFRHIYSYGDDGFETDDIMSNISWLATNSIYICVMFITKEEKERIVKFLKYSMKHQKETKYGTANILKAYIATPPKDDKRFICSSFTGYILNLANPKNLHRDYSRLRPEDVTILPRAFYIMNVHDRFDFEKKHDEIKRRVAEIYKDHKEELMDYNNNLPKLLLKDKMKKLKYSDKILDYVLDRCL